MLATSLVAAACTHDVHTMTIGQGQLVGHQGVSELRCPLRLKAVVDGRGTTGDSGGLGWNRVVVEDAPGLVRQQLLEAGLHPADAATGRDVVVTLKLMYLGQNNMTKNPVVVYEVVLDGGTPFLVRAQPTIANWDSTKGETVSAFSAALHQANDKLLAELNTRCDSR